MKTPPKVKIIQLFSLQAVFMEMDVVTVGTEASQFLGTPVSRGIPNTPISTTSMERSTNRLKIVAIYAGIQEGTLWMGLGVSPQIGP